MEGRLGSKLASRFGGKNDYSDSGDSLERDNGADFEGNLDSDLVIQVTQSDEERRGERSGNRNESIRSGAGQETEIRNRLKDRGEKLQTSGKGVKRQEKDQGLKRKRRTTYL